MLSGPPAPVATAPDVATVMSAIALQNALQQTALQTALLQQQQQQHQQFFQGHAVTQPSSMAPVSNLTPLDPRIKQEPASSSDLPIRPPRDGTPPAHLPNNNTTILKPAPMPITFTMRHVAPATRNLQTPLTDSPANAVTNANATSAPTVKEEMPDQGSQQSTPRLELKCHELPAGLMVSACSVSLTCPDHWPVPRNACN